MKLSFSYKHGYLSPVLELNLLETTILSSKIAKFRRDEEISLNVLTNILHLHSSFHPFAITPENLRKFFEYLGLQQLSDLKVDVKQLISIYTKQYQNQPYLGLKLHLYKSTTYPDHNNDLRGEIVHLTKLLNSSTISEPIRQSAEDWLSRFKRAQKITDLESTADGYNFKRIKIDLKKQALQLKQKENKTNMLATNIYSISRLLESGFNADFENSNAIKKLTNKINDLVEEQSIFRKILLAAGLWTLLGIQEVIANAKAFLGHKYLKTILISKKSSITTLGFYTGKHSIFVLPNERLTIKDIEFSSETYFHELTHAVVSLFFGNSITDSDFQQRWQTLSKEFIQKLSFLYSKKDISPEDYEILNYSHYPHAEWSDELIARLIEFNSNGKQLHKGFGSLLQEVELLLREFSSSAASWCKQYIQHSGLELIGNFNSFLQGISDTVSIINPKLLSQAQQLKMAPIDVAVQQLLDENLSPEEIIENLIQRKVDVAAILQAAARINHLELATNIFKNHRVKEKSVVLAFFQAAKYGHVEMLELFLQQKEVSLESKNNLKQTPLHIAAMYNQDKAVNWLISQGANMMANDIHQVTPYHFAIFYGHTKILEIYQRSKLDLSQVTLAGIPSIHCAAMKNQVASIKWLVLNAAEINEENQDGDTALHVAIRKNNMAAVTVLLELDANIDVQNAYGDSPLGLAILHGHYALAEKLLHKGAKVNTKNLTDLSPLHYAIAANQTKLVKLIFDAKDFALPDLTEIMDVNLQKTDPQILALIFVNSPSNQLGQILCDLINDKENENLELIESLLQNQHAKPAINYVNTNEGYELPIHTAAKRGKTKVVDLLLRLGADPNTNQKNVEWTPLHYAAEKGHLEVVKILLTQPSIQVTQKNSNQLTPLDLARKKGHDDVVKCLDEHLLCAAKKTITIDDNLNASPKFSPLLSANFFAKKSKQKAPVIPDIDSENLYTPLSNPVIPIGSPK